MSVRLVRRVGATNVAYVQRLVRGDAAAMAILASWAAAIYVAQFLWSLGSAGFPAVQQARLVAVAPMLAAATIAMNSSMTYLGGSIGATIGASAWTLVEPRFMPWVGFVFVLAALGCSMLGERATRAETSSRAKARPTADGQEISDQLSVGLQPGYSVPP